MTCSGSLPSELVFYFVSQHIMGTTSCSLAYLAALCKVLALSWALFCNLSVPHNPPLGG